MPHDYDTHQGRLRLYLVRRESGEVEAFADPAEAVPLASWAPGSNAPLPGSRRPVSLDGVEYAPSWRDEANLCEYYEGA